MISVKKKMVVTLLTVSSATELYTAA